MVCADCVALRMLIRRFVKNDKNHGMAPKAFPLNGRLSMTQMNQINIDLVGIGRALFNKKLAVPLYQRSYAWEERHVLDLLTDITTAMNNGEAEYFLGSIVTTKNDTDRPEVADGQQRLATSILLLAAIRDHFYDTGDLERANTISSKYLYQQTLATLEVIPNLRLNENDNDYFVKRILSNPDSEDRAIEATKGSHRKINDAAILAKKFVSKIAKAQDATQRLANIVDYVQDSVKVICVEVGNDANAFTIFETLNDRGLMLAISDLLKNYLFGRSDDRLPEVQQRWMNMMGTLDLLEDEGIAVTYIRHLWSSKHGLVREKELYSHITKHIRNKNHTIAFATELSDNAKLYTAILNPSNELWEKYGDTTRSHMETLNLLRMVQIRPLLLAVVGNFRIRETQKAFRLMVSWAVRFLIVGGLGGGTLEKHYSESGKAIRDNTIRTVQQLSEKLKKILPSDAKFKTAFSTATVSKQYLARYYLRVLEKEALGESDPELIPNDNVEVVNLEHVLPLQPNTATWRSFDEEEHSFYVRRLGNMALLKTRINTDAGNDAFKYKKKFYKKSNYTLTNNISEYRSWDKKAIEDRQAKLSELAVTAWPLK